MKKGCVVCYVAAIILVTTLLQTCSVTAFFADAVPQPFVSPGHGFPGFNSMRHRNILRDEVTARLKELGNVSDSKDVLQRTFLSPAALAAGRLLAVWMKDAGLRTWEDELGNVHGRSDGANATAPALLLGSHMDTVIDAGRYDGALGIVTAIAAVKVLKVEGKLHQFPRPIEIIAFSDEEGIRFQTTFLGSSAVAGTFQPKHLKNVDARGISIGAALRAASHLGTTESVSSLKYNPASVWGYVELHIEQGPVLEAHGLPLGVVEAIAGQTRLTVRVHGSQGHAGTVPMSMRKDPMIAAAQSIVSIENICTHPEKGVGGSRGATAMSTAVNHAGAIVCTVGEIHSWPGASNVIPGEVMFTIDVRSKDDSDRETNVVRIEGGIHKICRKRGVRCSIERKHEANAIACAPGLNDRLHAAAQAAMKELPPFRNNVSALDDGGFTAPTLVSGAGHDAMAMASLTQVGMLFLRCTGGVSHSPAEHVQDDDIWAGSLALLHFMEGVLGDLSR
ncbi:allantoate deiminase 2 [Physcomitrium patens]|uniref:Peptidase M20 dimerisation domain-containing protein n=1 Tax=Physcomitrium patens TaxID=3218 RepID=A0A2K1JKF1_PHYPA|nr:allantoate deiminase 2-like [Physcomitrium patens]PNR42021.1 hypothetical protein PHYPA_016850 [Physcomitrium patens]|eukprot:XP_024392183.1 allantoate deiminase 2-like [Physcomitrella patens]